MSNTISPIHKGLILEDVPTEPGYVIVMIPTCNTIVPPGFSEYIYENTGGGLHGKNLSNSKGTAYKCKIASTLTAGAWWRPDAGRACSYFDDFHNNAVDHRLNPKYQTTGNNGNQGSYNMASDNALSGSVNTLSVAGGTPKPQLATMPKGDFPNLTGNQHVLVAFVNSSMYPVVTHSIHSDEAWRAVHYRR